MSNADFDDIFGEDPKINAITAPTLTNINLDDDELFEEDYNGKMAEPSKTENCQSHPGSNWEQICSHEQDEFLSWLDDGGSAQAMISSPTDDLAPSFIFVPPPAPVHGFVPPATFDSVSLDDSDDFDRMFDGSTTAIHTRTTLPSVLTPVATLAFVSLDDDVDQFAAGASIIVSSSSNCNISLDDDDDDLESIVHNATKQDNASISRENSKSSLQIKSQVLTPHKAPIDLTSARQTYLYSGELPAGSRLALWHRAVQPGKEDIASMYAVQTTSRSLPSQALLRKEVEALCSQLFSSTAHARVLREIGDSMRGTHLLFIDSAETLITHLCQQLDIDYSSGMVLTFAPLLLASGCEPLHSETVEILAATCRRFLPHLGHKHSRYSSSATRRQLLKRLLLYHAPRLASYLNQNFPTWNEAPLEEYSKITTRGAIPDSWLSSFFEGERIASDVANFDFLLKVWDCNLVLEAFSLHDDQSLLTGCFITLYAIISAEKVLMRMTGEQLRHCMATTLIDTVLHGEMTKNKVFIQGIRHLIESTPSCLCAKLRSVDVTSPPTFGSVKPPEILPAGASTGPTNHFGVNTLLSASTHGLREMSNRMIDMPGKLLSLGSMNPMAALSASPTSSLTDSPEAQQLFYLHVQAMDVASVSVTLEAREVISSVFGGIQGHEAGSLRYFIVDCRSQEDTQRGQVPTAFLFDPDAVSDPAVLDHILALLGPLKTAGVHISVMGQGYAHIAEELRLFQQKQGVAAASPFTLSEDFLETYAKDQTRMQSTIDFLLKHEFPRVSVIDGGYAAAHGYLFRSHGLTVDDLADHDTPHCKLCHHDRSMETVVPFATFDSPLSGMLEEKRERNKDDEYLATAWTGSSRANDASMKLGFTDITLSPPGTTSTSPPAGSYYSSFAGVFKTGGKTLLSPTMDGTKRLLKKSVETTAEFANAAANIGNIHLKNRTGSIQGATAASKTFSAPAKEIKATMPNVSKFRSSLVAIGSESLDMLKKVESAMEHAVEQAAVATTTTTAKVWVPFSSSSSPTKKEMGAVASVESLTAKTPVAPRAALSADPAHSKFFHESTDETFTIDDDDENEDNEGQFVQYAEASDCHTSTAATFAKESSLVSSIHTVIKGHASQLKKGIMKKATGIESNARSCDTMNPRRVVVIDCHLVVLKSATRQEDDLFVVKSCHSLLHITRMTCLKKNALMVTIYYRWKAQNGEIVDKRNSYEVQQRDDFIKAVKTTMEKML